MRPARLYQFCGYFQCLILKIDFYRSTSTNKPANVRLNPPIRFMKKQEISDKCKNVFVKHAHDFGGIFLTIFFGFQHQVATLQAF
ncbi:MAG: hypothetical protein GPOALKHO_000231 [Sodalis sp.]|nr:MAG: hypothetical protein GPOALKHO_000231 [Sodalis sp.]